LSSVKAEDEKRREELLLVSLREAEKRLLAAEKQLKEYKEQYEERLLESLSSGIHNLD